MSKNKNKIRELENCSNINFDLSSWDTKGVLSMIPAKNTNYIKYAEAHNLQYWFQSILGKVIIMASERSHPKLFDGSLD